MLQRWLSVFCLAVSAASVDAEPLRVMSFNMLCSICAPFGYGFWSERSQGFEDTLRRADPDLLAVQELLDGWDLNTITRILPNLQAHFLDFGLPYYDSVVLFNRVRFELRNQGAFWLSPTPEAPVGFGWTASLPRAVAWIRLRDKTNGAEFYFVGTHMDNNRANKRPSTELIRTRLRDWQDLPIILAGDFNIKPDSHFTKLLTAPDPQGPGLIDSFDIAEQRVAVADSATGWEYGCSDDQPQKFPDCRIDHIFLSGSTRWRVSKFTVDMSRYGWRHQFISDHRPVWAELSWNERAP